MESPDVHIELSVYLKCKTLEHVRVSVKVREGERKKERERENCFWGVSNLTQVVIKNDMMMISIVI